MGLVVFFDSIDVVIVVSVGDVVDVFGVRVR